MEPQVQEIHDRLRDLRDFVRQHVEGNEDPKCAVLCATTAEVLNGLETCFDHFIHKDEKIWQ